MDMILLTYNIKREIVVVPVLKAVGNMWRFLQHLWHIQRSQIFRDKEIEIDAFVSQQIQNDDFIHSHKGVGCHFSDFVATQIDFH